MFKSKIFNSVMRYMLVAMLALLPNAIWGAIPEQTFMSLVSGNSATISGFDQYLTMNDYSAWYVYNADGSLVDISSWNASDTYHFTSFNKETDHWKAANSTSKCKITKCFYKSTPLVLRNSISFLVSH